MGVLIKLNYKCLHADALYWWWAYEIACYAEFYFTCWLFESLMQLIKNYHYHTVHHYAMY